MKIDISHSFFNYDTDIQPHEIPNLPYSTKNDEYSLFYLYVFDKIYFET